MEREIQTEFMGIQLKTKLSEELTHGTYLSREQMKELGIVPITAILPEATKLSGIRERIKLSTSDDHHLEVFQVEDKDAGIKYMQDHGMAESIAAPPMAYLMGVRDKETKTIIIPAEYMYLDIIDKDTVLVNNFLLVPIKYLDGTLTFVEQYGAKDSLGAIRVSEVIFKIMSTRDYLFAIEREDTILLIRAEIIYKAILSGYTMQELEKLGITTSQEPGRPRTRSLSE